MSNDSQLSYGEMIPKIEPDDTEGKPAVLTVRRVRRQNMAPKGSKSEEVKIVIEFAETFDARKGFNDSDATRREYIVNSTSYRTLADKLGPDENRWVGQQIVMAPTTTQFNGKSYEKLHVAAPDRWEKTVTATKRATSKR
jgi:hypothetical protein